MRVRLAFEPPLPPYKCWHKIGKHAHTIRDLQHDIFEAFQLHTYCKSLRLDLDGFYLVPSSPIEDLLRENDIVRKRIEAGSRDSSDSDNSNESSDATSESSSDSSDSESSSSDAESSSSSSSSSSDSDSSSSETSSSESDSSSESSSDESESVKQTRKVERASQKPSTGAPVTSKAATANGKHAPPFQGSTSTRKRNARRRLLKEKLREVRTLADQRGQNPSNQETKPLASPNVKKVTQRESSANKVNAHATTTSTTGTKEEPKTPQHSGSNVFITTSELSDRGARQTNQASKSRGKHNQKHHDNAIARPAKPHLANAPVDQDEQLSKNTITESSVNSSTQETKAKPITKPVDYDTLQPLEGAPVVGSRIAYKILEMSSSYTPVMSEFREAKVLAYDGVTNMAEVELMPEFRPVFEYDDDGHPILGKFDIYDPSDFERLEAGLVQLDMGSLADCRLVESSS
ncbi:hypothetical protein BGW41_008392 [Actinomortierella wolfii]|nr:hypothetical protein BGW41_008392 [Actinomortierella wolfii]